MAHTVLRPPWTIRFADRAPLIMVTVLRGGGTLVLPDGSRSCLVAGDTALVQAGEPFHLADTAAALDRPHTRYELSCFVPDGFGPADISCATPELIVTPSTTGAPEETSLLVGAYRAAGRRHERLLRALPQVMVVHEDAETCLWLEQSAADAVRLSAGSQALMDRLLDWALVCTLRSWLAEQQHCAPAWYRGMSDPVVGPALSAIHDRPFDRWTVASLATEAAVSRALFARRFTEVMGEPRWPTSRNGAWPRPRNYSPIPRAASHRWPRPSATPMPSVSARRSSGCAAPARPSSGWGSAPRRKQD